MRFCAIVYLVVVFNLMVSPSYAKSFCRDDVKILVVEEFFPFIYKESDGQLSGLDVQFMRKVFDGIGCGYEFIYLPWKRALIELEEGRLDMIPIASVLKERKRFARFSIPYRNETVGLVVRKGELNRFRFKSLTDLIRDMEAPDYFGHKIRIGNIRGTYRGEAFEELVRDEGTKNYFLNVNHTKQGIRMLLGNRIDIYVEMPATVFREARQLGVRDLLEEHPIIIHREPVYFMFSKKTIEPAFIDQVNEQIKILLEDETYHQLFGSMALNYEPIL